MENHEPSFKTDASDLNTIEKELPIEDALKKISAYKKPQRKKSRSMGLIAFLLSLLAGLAVLIVCGSALLSLLNRSLTLGQIRLVLNGVLLAGIVSFIALVLSIVTYFIKSQRKGFAITATVLSCLILIVCSAGIYVYGYTFGQIQQDEAFNQLSQEQLHVQNIQGDGEVNRDSEVPVSTVAKEEIEIIVMEKVESNPEVEVEWEHLTDEDLPEEALDKANGGDPYSKSYLTGDHSKIQNFALFGLDKVGSSDSVMIFSFDRIHHKLKLISIPRDSYVILPAWGSYVKLAYPYLWGGAEWAVGTINHNYSMNIMEYIAVDMEQLADIIDLVGGVNVHLDYAELRYLSRFPGLTYGENLLSGEVAVLYSRIRESSATDNEKNRTGRQREVLMSIMNQLDKLSWSDYPEFIRTCLGMCTTSFDNEQLMELCAEVVQNNYTIEQHALLDHLDYWGGKLGQEQYFYVVYDLNRASDRLYRLIYEDLYVSGYEED